MKELTQDIFNNQPNEVNWCGVDYDGLLSFGKAINPRYTYASERWRGFEQIGQTIENSGFKPLTSINKITNVNTIDNYINNLQLEYPDYKIEYMAQGQRIIVNNKILKGVLLYDDIRGGYDLNYKGICDAINLQFKNK